MLIDTVTARDQLKEISSVSRLNEELFLLGLDSFAVGRDAKIKDLKAQISTAEGKVKEVPDGIAYIVIDHTYRAKNGFGALDLGKLVWRYHPNRKGSERFELWDKE